MIRKLLGSTSGTSVIEFAIIAPVFIFLFIGLIEVGRYMYIGIITSHAARAGVQYGARNLTTAADASINGPATRSAALADAQNYSGLTAVASLICTVNGQSASCPANTANAVPAGMLYYVKVQVSGTFNPMMKYPGIPTSVPVTATATMPVNNQ